MANPHRKSHKVRRRSNTRRKHNPFRVFKRSKNRHYHRRRRNPFGTSFKELAISTAFAIGGGVATRSVPEALLGPKNAGALGYLANAATAAVAVVIADKIRAGAGQPALLGAAVAIAGRALEEYTGQKLVSFESVPLPFVPRMAGDFSRSNFCVPYSSTPGGRLLSTPPPVAAPVAVPAGMGVWRGPWKN